MHTNQISNWMNARICIPYTRFGSWSSNQATTRYTQLCFYVLLSLVFWSLSRSLARWNWCCCVLCLCDWFWHICAYNHVRNGVAVVYLSRLYSNRFLSGARCATYNFRLNLIWVSALCCAVRYFFFFQCFLYFSILFIRCLTLYPARSLHLLVRLLTRAPRSKRDSANWIKG